MRERQEWSGTATELLDAMGESGERSTVITKWLNEYRTNFLLENGIRYEYKRKGNGRKILLSQYGSDRNDRYDGSSEMSLVVATGPDHTAAGLSPGAKSEG